MLSNVFSPKYPILSNLMFLPANKVPIRLRIPLPPTLDGHDIRMFCIKSISVHLAKLLASEKSSHFPHSFIVADRTVNPPKVLANSRLPSYSQNLHNFISDLLDLIVCPPCIAKSLGKFLFALSCVEFICQICRVFTLDLILPNKPGFLTVLAIGFSVEDLVG
ncbi:hypothetical protein N7495_008433 [Penicillium taxi]|uniref:uncharacterized protein n=1 Tax=Penicillium taxi TaxID=168475 RepID=UPI0025459366|nr:uncharacterized protein N7495_008433 [Penicillium taxi]KAJ5888392.1 hypothetical protein N7495_008433 [Penicillium taxi]